MDLDAQIAACYTRLDTRYLTGRGKALGQHQYQWLQDYRASHAMLYPPQRTLEIFTLVAQRWDVNAAYHLLTDKAQLVTLEPETVRYLAAAAQWIHTEPLGAKQLTLSVPIITVPFAFRPGYPEVFDTLPFLPIDGWHRIVTAAQTGKSLRAFHLSREMEKLIQLGK